MKPTRTNFDVAIIGSGIAGSALGAILARQGLKVVIFEAKTHPRFAIGESMILETSETLRAMAELYDVPELAYFSSENYFAHVGTSHGVKRHFSYLYHRPGQSQQIAESLQAVIPKQPHGHELHLYRQDSDYFMMTVAVAYGATVLQNTPVQDIAIDADGVTIIAKGNQPIRAHYVVDAGGFRSLLADKFDLRDTNLHTHSRTIFTHMVSVPGYNEVGASQNAYGLPFGLAEGTLHHVFEGGWLWVIPFNNHARATNPLCSVGLMLDPRIHPQQDDLSAEEEFYRFIAQFPSIKAHLRDARAVRDWTRTGRIQYSSRRIVGDRFCLLGHAAGFIDPLFSKGLYTSMMSVSVLAHLLLEACKDGDFSAARFQPLEDITLAFIRTNDRLIANAYRSFGNYKLWSVLSVLWLLGAYTELVKLMSARAQATSRSAYYAQVAGLHLAGGGFTAFDALSEQVYRLIEATDPHDAAAVDRVVTQIKAVFAPVDWMPQAFHAVLHGKNHLPARKLRLSLLNKEDGFLGKGSYRQHFFGDYPVRTAVQFFLRDKIRYSVPVLNMQRRMKHA